jgi:putative CocE/NonD family hydrolase
MRPSLYIRHFSSIQTLLLGVLLLTGTACSSQDASFVKQNYTKLEQEIPMRDGARLFTSIYIPRDQNQDYPILLNRTPYSVSPYGEKECRSSLGPSMALARDGYIFVYQDVRGKYMSEGEFEAVRPHKVGKQEGEFDESSDTYDTVEWLLNHIPHNTGNVGVWGVSAPGFYATHTLIESHPAIKAVSPQAPVTDWWMGDDRHHNGALQLQATFSFVSSYGASRPEPTTVGSRGFRGYGTEDGYAWYLDLGPLSNVNERHFKYENRLWNDIMAHETYDAFWQARTPLPHLRNVKPAVLVTGGFFDAQDLYGPLKTYATIEEHNPETPNFLVMGPWRHGGWARGAGDRYGNYYFGSNTSEYYRAEIERPFFNHYLKGEGSADIPEASIFITGSNEWRSFEAWPPPESEARPLYLLPNGGLGFEAPFTRDDYVEYVSDPQNPVPNTQQIVVTRDDRYVIQDQRYAAEREDVVVFETEDLSEDLTFAGDLYAHLYVSTTGTDADFVVKLIDVYPDDASCELPDGGCTDPMGGYQQMVRGDGEVTEVSFDMEDIAHTFRKGHKMMVQIHSTWFPMVDRNPQRFMNMREVAEGDYQVATHRVYFSSDYPSHLSLRALE